MLEKIKQLIREEDKKNPLSDEKIAQKLAIRRERVIMLRTEAGIVNFRERRHAALYKDAAVILHSDPKISERAFASELRKCGYEISRYVAAGIKKELNQDETILTTVAPIIEKKSLPENVREVLLKAHEPFSNIIGFNGGLQVQVNQAKAAILYPPDGLHTLITGASGVGKSYLAESMYHFAKENLLIPDAAAFVVFNCADYADNPQLLLAQLFGYAKGAFSGAVTSKAGLVEKADRGILFLDEVHRLPSEGQEILFSILDKGEFRRLGETQTTKVSIRIIAATTENIESALLLTFRRRIPMLIDLPNLSERPFEERYALIRKFFVAEAVQTKRVIKVDEKVLRFFLVYPCLGNIGQLLSDIRVACANAFLLSVAKNRREVSIYAHNLMQYEDIHLFSAKKEAMLKKYISKPLVIDPITLDRACTSENQPEWELDTIYDSIEDEVLELKSIGIEEAKIQEILQRKIKEKISAYVFPEEDLDRTMEELSSVVDDKIVQTVKKAMRIAKEYLPSLDRRVYYFLSIHLSMFYDRMKRGIYREFSLSLKNIMTRYQREYEVACMLVRDIEQTLSVKFPPEEIGMIAMYLYTFSHSDSAEEGRVKVIVLSHGKVASAMTEVANRLLNMHYAIGIDMDFNEAPAAMFEKVVHVVEEVNEGKGCLLLVDIGSLVSIGDRITARTGIPVACVDRVDTAMLLEAVRRAATTTVSLEEIAAALKIDKFGMEESRTAEKKAPAVLLICITGAGTAKRLEEYVQEKLDAKYGEIKMFKIGALNLEVQQSELAKITAQYKIVVMIGNIKLQSLAAPFISSQEIFSGCGIERLQNLLEAEVQKEVTLADVLAEQTIICQLNLTDKTQIMDQLSGLLYEQGAVDASFLLSAYKRESTGATYLNGGIGIPHGSAEHVKKSAIAVASLVRPVLWENNFMVDLVFLLALKESDQKYINALFHIISDEKALSSLKEADSNKKILNILLKKQF
ncbi:sigma 54-interacting transcriptional regulator [Anaerosinus massiliensis]|uniref:sigma 54-interacting transcriptional regulator n=1 Tax=Massilibacillus massiliensis TaxID=1806837 RepID=UPI000A4F3500|nr:sigma 54-interacting transcriptional regulator [Massilibacillus massiliensis]